MLKNSLLLGFFFLIVAVTSCSKQGVYDEGVQMAIDEAKIDKWADSIGLDLQKHESGLYYEVISEGEGSSPVLTDSLIVEYEARKLGDSISFSKADDINPYKFLLRNSIEAWRIGLPMIKEGGRIRLLVPSPLGYRNYDVGNVPKNTVLDFTIDFIEIVKD